MPYLSAEESKTLKSELATLAQPVRVILFTQKDSCEYCDETHKLLEEICSLSDRISLEILDIAAEQSTAQQLGIERVPATVIMGDRDYGIRFYGIPSGYEFTSLVDSILMVGKGESGLSQKSKDDLGALQTPIHLKVFVTPT